MAKQTYTIKTTGQRVEIKRNLFWRNILITLDGRQIGRFSTMDKLKKGVHLKSPTGTISVIYKQRALSGSGFEVWHNKALLEGSLSDPVRIWRTGYQVAMFLGVFNSVVGLISLVSKNSFLTSLGAGPFSLIFGIVLLLLGGWSWQQRSPGALKVAACLFGLDAVLGIVALVSGVAGPAMGGFLGGLLLRGAFILAMWQGGSVDPDTEAGQEGVMKYLFFLPAPANQSGEFKYNWDWRPRTLQIRHRTWRNIIVTLGDDEIGRFKSWRDLKQGALLKTPLGTVSVEYTRGPLLRSGFSVWYEGRILDGSVNHPDHSWLIGYRITLGIGIFNLLIAAYLLILSQSYRGLTNAINYQLAFSGVLLFLGWWSRQQRSAIALGLAALIFAGDALFTVISSGAKLPPGFVAGLFLRAVLVFGMARGAWAIWGVAAEPDFPYDKEKIKNSY